MVVMMMVIMDGDGDGRDDQDCDDGGDDNDDDELCSHLLTVEAMSQRSKAEAPKASAARLISSLMLLRLFRLLYRMIPLIQTLDASDTSPAWL